ncbi:hypothetical protein [Candidatus Poriferisocius sp.]|uniref:hypothetical protein n=1 Tax=Candidatus Poriferisocius sp. TaxID=3101276 RepID=UPI003B011F36
MKPFAHMALAALIVGAGLALAAPAMPGALADTGVPETDKCELSPDDLRINVLLLLDASKSLERTDPENARRAGLNAAVRNLADLAGSNPEAEIYVAVDTFATGYERRHGWQDAEEAHRALAGRFQSITSLPGPGTITYTDYRQAMQGAAGRFGEVPGNCNILLWFTDGEHATEGTSPHVSDREWEQLREACRSSDMQQLAEQGVWSLAVLLSSTDSPASAGPLRQLFGVGDSPCRHALDGDIRLDIGADDLSDALGELIAETIYTIDPDTDDDLPGEPDGQPPDEDYEPCEGGDGTEDRPCLYHFSLDEGDDSFRVFVDMTYLNRGIRNPVAVNMVLQSPSGRRSEPIASVAPVGGQEIVRYQPVARTGFLSHRPYDSRWEIIGHQAAQQLTTEADWEWAGEWALLFWGETPQAVEDAIKVAAAFRAITQHAPSAEMSVDGGNLVGFIRDFPNAYSSVELRLRLDGQDGKPVYPTRPYLICRESECDPVPVSGDDSRRFEIMRVVDETFWWDSLEAGGNGLELTAAHEARGPVSTTAVLEQEFLYGGADGFGSGGSRGQPLAWVRDIGQAALDLQETIDVDREIEKAKENWEDLKEVAAAMEAGEIDPIPTGLELHDPPYDLEDDRVVFRADVNSGYFSGIATLEGVRAQIENRQLAGDLTFDREWSCPVPADGGRVTCRAIPIDLGLSEDATVVVELDFDIALAGDWEELAETVRASTSYEGETRSWSPPDDEWAAVWDRIRQAAASRRVLKESDPFPVDLITPGDKLREFLLLLIFLVALALALRVLAAWRLRPWKPLRSADYLVKSLDVEDGAGAATADLQMCMDLTRRSTSGLVGGVRLFSVWKPLLMGGPPRLAAKAPGSRCVGPQGRIGTRRQSRRREQTGLVGHSLDDGWVVDISPTGRRLIVWDLRDENAETVERLAEAENEAGYWIERTERGEASMSEEDAASSSREAQPAPPPDEGRDPFGDAADDDPFAE